MRFAQIPILFAVVSLAIFSLPSLSAGPPSAPNVIIIYADDHAQNAIGCYGSTINRTPNIDRLAADGMRFTQSFVANSICGPARATLLTGLHSHANGQTTNHGTFRDELPTFVKSLDAAGYDTAIVGKWHLPTLPNGFDHWTLKQGSYYNPTFKTVDGMEACHGYATDVITEKSLDWIRNREESGQPFCLWISHSAAHRTWSPPLRHLHRYADVIIPEPETLFDDYVGRAPGAAVAQMRISRDLFPAYDLKLPVTAQGILDDAAQRQMDDLTVEQRRIWDTAFGPRNVAFAEAQLSGDDLTRWNYQRYIKNYLRCVDAIDDSVGRVREFLHDQRLAENTVVIYTSDQGFFLGEHGWYDKRWMYEPSLRSPLIVCWPRVVGPGTTSTALIQNIDLAPTILDVCGLQTEPGMHGKSMLPLLKQEQVEWRDAIYYHYQMKEPPRRTSHLVAKHYGVRTKQYKLIYFYELGAWELYDLTRDPDEIDNLYGKPETKAITQTLKQRLSDLRRRFGDRTGKPFSAES
jgi:arylsulfatase A-like enzyme